eukprot:TRINITY_DN5064_c0_g1_i2.p1 TRINITY_DN5064_c0_g1~~TRINITY_DN5064_c0_g1_i2.p1  ORF type:complete len:101 (+),score=13.83 TRINITY_DN5064_c0_g1_i2:61-363(+)
MQQRTASIIVSRASRSSIGSQSHLVSLRRVNGSKNSLQALSTPLRASLIASSSHTQSSPPPTSLPPKPLTNSLRSKPSSTHSSSFFSLVFSLYNTDDDGV